MTDSEDFEALESKLPPSPWKLQGDPSLDITDVVGPLGWSIAEDMDRDAAEFAVWCRNNAGAILSGLRRRDEAGREVADLMIQRHRQTMSEIVEAQRDERQDAIHPEVPPPG